MAETLAPVGTCLLVESGTFNYTNVNVNVIAGGLLFFVDGGGEIDGGPGAAQGRLPLSSPTAHRS